MGLKFSGSSTSGLPIPLLTDGAVVISIFLDSGLYFENTVYYNVILHIGLGKIEGPTLGYNFFRVIFKWYTTATVKIW